MKQYLILITLFACLPGYAQTTAGNDSRGHYRELSMIDNAPRHGADEIDQKRFPHNPASVEKLKTYKLVYLQDVSSGDFLIPDPPANSSLQTRAELDYLLRLQDQRTKLDIESALHMAGVFYNPKIKPGDEYYEAYRNNLFFIGRSIGTWFNPETLPLTADFMARVWNDASYFIWSLKFKYLRVRPYVLDTALNNLEETNWAAYPSGHASNSYINAFIYQELAPQFTDFFLKDAYDMAHSREIIGVHYPSDSEAGRIFARQFVDRLLKNPQFVVDLEAVKEEWSQKARESFAKPAKRDDAGAIKPANCRPQPECKAEE